MSEYGYCQCPSHVLEGCKISGPSFLNCRVAQGLWNSVYRWFDTRFSHLFVVWKLGVGPSRGRILWRTSFVAIIWVIWQERNNRCFNDNSLAEGLLSDKVKFPNASWASPLPSFKGISVVVILRNWKEVAFSSPASPPSVQRWTPPPL